MLEIAFYLLFFVLLIVAFRYAIKHQKKQHQARFKSYMLLALKLNMTENNGEKMLSAGPTVRGIRNGRSLHIYQRMKGAPAKNNQTSYINIEFPESKLPFDFKIEKSYIISKIEQKLGFSKFMSGNQELDEIFHFKTNQEMQFKGLMTKEFQEALKEVAKDFWGTGTLMSKNGVLKYSASTTMDNHDNHSRISNVIYFMEMILNAFPAGTPPNTTASTIPGKSSTNNLNKT